MAHPQHLAAVGGLARGSHPPEAALIARALLLAAVLAPTLAFGQANCAGTSVGLTPLTDLAGRYLDRYAGGLYEGGNVPPADHAAAGVARGLAVTPRRADGTPDPAGVVVLLSVGMSSLHHEWCRRPNEPTCAPGSFIERAAADPAVNHASLAIVNGARDGEGAEKWIDPAGVNYDVIRDGLAALGLTEAQVQVVVWKAVAAFPTAALPAADADAWRLLDTYGRVMRALAVRYPNLQQAFVLPRIYAGYAKAVRPLHPEPYAYEQAFALKWLIDAQVRETREGTVSAKAGSLNYAARTAPWIGWAAYTWADGLVPRADGLTYACGDVSPTDGTHPWDGARTKVVDALLGWCKTDPATPWCRT